MKKVFLAVSILAAAGCGGGGGPRFVDPASVKFSYGSPTAVGTGTPEADAATAGTNGAGAADGLSQASDDPQAQSLANLPNDVASAAFPDSSGLATAPARARAALTRRAATFASGDLVAASAGFDDPGCVTVSLLAVKYDHCVYTDTTDGTVITIDGTFSRAVGADSVDLQWNATAGVRVTSAVQGGTLVMVASNHLQGDVTVTLAGADLVTIAGAAKSDVAVSVSAPGASASAAYTDGADLDLDYQPSLQCVTGGTLEVKRLWAQRPSGATAAQLPDLGAKFEWTGCNVATVSWGTLP
jgi:hypothetical protein